jgi:hypothetical protein
MNEGESLTGEAATSTSAARLVVHVDQECQMRSEENCVSYKSVWVKIWTRSRGRVGKQMKVHYTQPSRCWNSTQSMCRGKVQWFES